MGLPTLSSKEIAKHNTAKSCYVTLGNKVYDVTTFLRDHPGGDDLILDYAGQDIGSILDDELSHKHSEAAYEVLDDCLVGFKSPIDMMGARGKSGLPPSPPSTPDGIDHDDDSVSEASSLSNEVDEEEALSVETDAAADFRKNGFLDLNKPLFMQVLRGNFSKDFYLEQVHKPRHYKGGESAPFFGNFLEPLSKTPWWVVPLVWIPSISYGMYLAKEGLGWIMWAATFLLGLAIWTLIEYTLHRCLFHLDDKMPDHNIANTLHFLFHGVHHYLPMDRLRLVMPPTLFIALATPFYFLAHACISNWSAATAVFCGAVFGYVCYDLTHYFLHHKNLPGYYKDLKKYHLQHHFTDFNNGFGVTSRFWDRVFGTELQLPTKPITADKKRS
ncbi:inositolphosphorylceramide-B C-26 hydroxylase [Ascobolus immersus RN42]|uniref:Ceramide very long chain fatty acid hydroxylase n=1 Tax=Ascobolus immersus RN42 TaxID=1160509 RepID=A0A3N4HX96_ASCIM|nr:inositolphosphorylceramide-B C-26 hydroxylase [Ascobolus immersus RN42]